VEEIILDQPAIQQDKSQIKYGTFWRRVGGTFLDWLVMVPFSYGIAYLNSASWRSSVILVLLSLIPLGYKPLMEFRYGATLGKMALNLRVRNLEFAEASLGAILLRNIFHIIPLLISLLSTLAVYNNFDLGLVKVAGFRQHYFEIQHITFAFFFLSIIDAIALAADPRKRSLHDRIGGTVVVNQP
jgi:uncharacterized RDD family membrane protein YckC